MRRYWVPQEWILESEVKFQGEIFHHIFDVCRQDVGSRFEVIHGPTARLVEVTAVQKKSAHARILSQRQLPSPRPPHITLALSAPRPQVLDSVVERCVELGVFEVWPFISDFSFFRKKADLEKRRERLEKIVISATQQTGRGDLMKIQQTQNFSEILNKLNPSPTRRCLFLYEGEGQKPLKTALQEKADAWILLVGSEGGFSPTEVQALQQENLAAITMGEQVLRVETACLAAISILQYESQLTESKP